MLFVLAAMAVCIAVSRLQPEGHAVNKVVLVGRLLTGVSIRYGQYGWTNAGWRSRAAEVRVLHRSGRASWWQHQNLAFRTAVRSGPLLVAAGILTARWVTVAVLAAGTAAVLVRVSAGKRLRWPGRHRRGRVQPVAEALSTITGTAPKAVQAGVKWNRDYVSAKPGAEVVTWELPPAFKASPKERGQIEHLWQSRVGLDLKAEWRTADATPRLVLRRARELPPLARLEDWMDRLDALPAHKIGIGPDDQGNLVCRDYHTENPHGLIVGGSGSGKTEGNRAKTAQVLRKGGSVTAVDCKRVSFQGLEGVLGEPFFVLRNNPRDITSMWLAIKAFHDEMDARMDAQIKDPTAEFPHALLIIEEVAQFSAMTDVWWEELPTEDPEFEGTLLWKPRKAKKTPRVWGYVNTLCWEGREFNCTVDVSTQSSDANKITALKAVRDVLGWRYLGGYQPQQWKACVGTTPVPAAPAQKGRFCVVSGADQTWVQAICGDVDKTKSAAVWRDYARAGRRLDGSQPVTVTGDGRRSPTSGAHTGTHAAVTVTERLCACGCGGPVPSPRPEAKYATPACRMRAHRAGKSGAN